MFIHNSTINASGSMENLCALVEDPKFSPLIRNIRIGGAKKDFDSKKYKAKTGKSLHELTCDITVDLQNRVYDVQQLLGSLTSDYALESLELKHRFVY